MCSPHTPLNTKDGYQFCGNCHSYLGLCKPVIDKMTGFGIQQKIFRITHEERRKLSTPAKDWRVIQRAQKKAEFTRTGRPSRTYDELITEYKPESLHETFTGKQLLTQETPLTT